MRTLRYLTTDEVAAILRVPVSTLYAWRYRKYGPTAIKVGRALKYPENSLQRWLDAELQLQTGDAA